MKTNIQVKKKRRGLQKNLFYWGILAFPILQFVIFYICVNLNSFALAFQYFDYELKGFRFVGFENFFQNFNEVVQTIKETTYLQQSFKNSFIVYGISLVTTMPLSLLFSYYIYKKKLMSKIFRVILFLPNVISSITLVIIYKYFVEQAIPEVVLRFGGSEIEGLLTNPNTEFATILFFSIWLGYGTSTIIYSGAMSSISQDIVEAAQIDGITPLKEFFLITLPMIFPTISVYLVSGVAGILANQMNLFSFYGPNASNYSIWNIGYYIYNGVSSSTSTYAVYPYYATFGLVMSMITIPCTFLVKFLVNKIDPFKE